jgi:sialic acid synthase SpsE
MKNMGQKMNRTSIQLGSRVISDNSMPYIIAEIGVNHEGSMERAKELIYLAKEGGADAAKFQSYKAETLASKHSPAYWDTSKEPTLSQYELFKKHDGFGEEEYTELADYCHRTGIDFVSTPFDDRAVDFLAPLVPCIKIASADITNLPLLRKTATKGKPVLLSTGASTLAEIELAIAELYKCGCSSVALLHCVLSYPTRYESTHLNMIIGLQTAFPNHIVGYSDHALPDEGMLVLTAAYLKGARIIEKHFTFDKRLPGNDHYHAMDLYDLRKFKAALALLAKIEGNRHKTPLPDEALAIQNARRSIVLKKPANKGEILTECILTCKRPGFGISPIHWDKVIGKKTVRNLPEDHLLQWWDLDNP